MMAWKLMANGTPIMVAFSTATSWAHILEIDTAMASDIQQNAHAQINMHVCTIASATNSKTRK